MFENGLNPEIPLQGTTTTHPTLQQPLSDQLQANATLGKTTADTNYTNAATGLVGEQTTGANLENQLKQMSLNNTKALGDAYRAMLTGGQNQTTPQPSQTTPQSNTSVMSGAGPSGAPVTSTGTPSNQPVLPPGVDPSWTVNKNADWYNDAQGNPVSRLNGPKYTPSGQPNMMNGGMISDLYNHAIAGSAQNGGNPAALIAARTEALEKAQDFDAKSATIQETYSKANKANQEVQNMVQEHTGNIAFDVTNSATPLETLHNAMMQQPRVVAGWMQSLGIQSPDQMVGPDGKLTPQAQALLSPQASYSEAQQHITDMKNKTTQVAIEQTNAKTRQFEAEIASQKIPIEAAAEGRKLIEAGGSTVQSIGQLDNARTQIQAIQKAIDSGGLEWSGRSWVVNTEKMEPGLLKDIRNMYGPGIIAPDNTFQLYRALKQATAAGTDAYLSANPAIKAGSETRFSNVANALTGGADFSSNPKGLSDTLKRADGVLAEIQGSKDQILSLTNSQLKRLGISEYTNPGTLSTKVPATGSPTTSSGMPPANSLPPSTPIIRNQADYDSFAGGYYITPSGETAYKRGK